MFSDSARQAKGTQPGKTTPTSLRPRWAGRSVNVLPGVWLGPGEASSIRGLALGGPLGGGGAGAVVPGGQAGATAASAVPRPRRGAAETAAATGRVDAIRFRRVRSWPVAGVPGSDGDEVIRGAFLGADGRL